jgi:hypothetical protein
MFGVPLPPVPGVDRSAASVPLAADRVLESPVKLLASPPKLMS